MKTIEPKKIITVSIVLAVNLIICLLLYNFSTAHDLEKSSGLLKKIPHPGPQKTINIGTDETKRFAFLCDVKLTPRAIRKHHTLLVHETEGFQLILAGKKDIQLQWERKTKKGKKGKKQQKLFPAVPGGDTVLRFFPSTFKGRKWNQVGFVYNKGIASVYINGKLLWESRAASKKEKIKLDGLVLAPKGKDNTNRTIHPFHGKIRSALFFNRILSRQEIKEHFSYTFNPKKSMGSPAFILFLVFVLLNAIWMYLFFFGGRIVRLFFPGKEAGEPNPVGIRLALIIIPNIVFFVLFNLGHRAAQYFSHISNYPGPGIYWLVLNVVFFLVLFTLLMEKLARVRLSKCIHLSVFILLFPLLVCFLSQLPRFGEFYPFVFNIILAFGFSLIPAAYDVLRLTHLTSTEKAPAGETR